MSSEGFGLLVATFWLCLPLLLLAILPGKSYPGQVPPLGPQEQKLEQFLKKVVEELASRIGPRNLQNYSQYQKAAQWIRREWERQGYTVREEDFLVRGKRCVNLIVEIPGKSLAHQVVIFGAHYDTDEASGTPGADDNASGVAALLALSKLCRERQFQPERTVRFVAFANEEAPYFGTSQMGSYVHAQNCRKRGEQVVAMYSLETIGYYSEDEGSQKFPLKILGRFYPTRGNFIGFVSNIQSRSLLSFAIGHFRKNTPLPSEGAFLPASIAGVSWSDHWAFWQHSYPAIMVTDTAPFRNPYYHTLRDTPETLDYRRLTWLVYGLYEVLIASGKESVLLWRTGKKN